MKLILKIFQALFLSLCALVVLLNSELSQIETHTEAKRLDLNPSVSLSKPLR
jgi:hypothetical protein